MNCKISKALGGCRLVAVLSVTASIFTTSGGRVMAQSNASEAPVGTWVVQVTLRDCATSAPVSAPFTSLVTLHRGGTLSESAGGTTFAPGQRSSGHGTWTDEGGNTYRQRIGALINFDTPPNLPGSPGFNPSLPISPGFFAGGNIDSPTPRRVQAPTDGASWHSRKLVDYTIGTSDA